MYRFLSRRITSVLLLASLLMSVPTFIAITVGEVSAYDSALADLTISCFGDSITKGYPYGIDDPLQAIEKIYPSVLQGKLDNQFGAGHYFVINHGINGLKAEEMRANLQLDGWLNENPLAALVMIGGNDLSAAKTLEEFMLIAQETVEEVQDCVDIIKGHINPDGQRPAVIVSAFPPNLLGVLANEGIMYYNDLLENRLVNIDLFFSDNFETFYDSSTGQAKSELMYDPVHPNDVGYAVIAENWNSALLQVISGSSNPNPFFHPHTEFWFTWYDRLDTEICNIHFVNTGISTTTVSIYIAGSQVDSFTLGAGLSTYRNYAVNNGPVHIVGTQPLWVTKRVVGWGGFKEVYGLPGDAASTDICYTWYDFSSPEVVTDKIYLTNPSASLTATAQIYIGGSFMKSVTLSPGESKYEVFPSVINGPVRITSDVPIFSTQLVIGWGDFDEIVGTPSWYVANEHYFTWYDLAGASIDNIHMINPSASTAQISIYIAGVLKTATPISLPSGAQTYVNYPGVIGGPVRIVSDQQVRVTQRIVGWNGFKEVFSVPVELLASGYYFTWYDWASPSVTWDALHFMNPSATQTAHITIKIGGATMETVTLGPGEVDYATYQGTINGPILITSDIPIMTTQRILGWSSFEETIGIQWT